MALIAGLVALQAYAAATGLPDLKLQFKVPSGHPNEPRFIEEQESGSMGSLGQARRQSPPSM